MNTELENFFNEVCCPPPVYNFDVNGTSLWGTKYSFESALGVTVGGFKKQGNNVKAEILTTTNNTIYIGYENITSVNYITVNGLKTLAIGNTTLFDFDPILALPSSLETLRLAVNKSLLNFDPTIPLPSGLKTLGLNDNSLTGFNPSTPLPATLQTLGLEFNNIEVFSPTINLPTSLKSIGLTQNKMTTSSYIASEPWAVNQPAFTSLCAVRFSGNINPVTGTNLRTILISKNCNVIA